MLTGKIRLFFVLHFFIFLFAFEWVDYNGYNINSKVIVIKIKKEFAPLLGIDSPLTIESRISLNDKLNQLGAIDLSPLFIHSDSFTSSHYSYDLHQYYRVTFQKSINFSSIEKILSEDSFVDIIEPSYIKEVNFEPNDQYYEAQWAHNNTGQAVSYGGSYVGTPDCDTDTNDAWDISTGNSASIIAILDTGVSNHSEFSGRLVAGYNFISNNTNANDDQGHGTSCAGIAAAKGNNSSGIAGVCWDCNIMPVKVLDSGGYGDDTGISNGIQWATDNGASVISMSLGGGGYVSYTDSAVNYATDNGTVVVAASGNDNYGSLSYPSGYSNCISVGSLSPCNERKDLSSCDGENYWGSNYGTGLDFLAPGVRIHTTTMSGGYTSTFNGTSSACPHAAGIAGLIKSESLNISAYDVRLLMQQSSVDIAAVGYDAETGHGRVNAYNSLFNLLYNPEAFIDIDYFDVELSYGSSTEESFVIANVGETDLEYEINTEEYYWKSSSENNFDYSWIDISEDSNQLSFNHNDYAADQIVNLNFDFPFYDSFYSSLIVNANGWIGFGEDNSEWDNSPLPNSSAPSPAIFGFWDDLNPINSSGSGEGYVYYHSNSERTVVWFNQVQHWPTNFEGSVYDFQIVLYPSGNIIINYRDMEGLVNSATIGVQNTNGENGTLVNYNYSLVEDEYSILIYRTPSWLEISPTAGIVAPSDASEIQLNIFSSDLSEGEYFYDLIVETNDYENSLIAIPITLTVTEEECSGWLAGDIDQDGEINILDVTIMINIALGFVEAEECQYLASDLNQDETVNVLDVIALVNIILS